MIYRLIVLLIILCGFYISGCEAQSNCTGLSPADHTVSVEDGGCRHKAGLNSPSTSGCWTSSCHKGNEALSFGTARSCYTCHGKFWN